MDLLNSTRMPAGYTLGMEPSGREHLVVAVKGTFTIPAKGGEPTLAEVQVPLVEADSFTGEPGVSAPVYETDYPLRKPRCDVLLNGSAHAPGGRPATKVQVALKLGAMVKTFNVLGERIWYVDGANLRITPPRPFEVMPITYDRAFGGVDDHHPDPAKHTAYMANPVGRGYHGILARAFVEHQPLPNTEERDKPIRAPNEAYRPMAFGPLGRGWWPRYRLAGTYDERWLDEDFPFPPADFDEAYHQAAPPDQQIPYPKGGEPVTLVNLSSEGRIDFELPRVEVPILCFLASGEREPLQAVIDTVVIEPQEGRFTLTWRASRALRRNMFEVSQVLVGEMPRAWWRARDLGKIYYPGLEALARERREEGWSLVDEGEDEDEEEEAY